MEDPDFKAVVEKMQAREDHMKNLGALILAITLGGSILMLTAAVAWRIAT